MAESALNSFRESLEETKHKTGYNFQILHPNFNSVLSNGRIYAHWFEPGTVIASAEADGNVIIFDIAGELNADIFDPEGAVTKTFEGRLTEIGPVEGLRLVSDKDINALTSENGQNGYTMSLYEGNVVRAYLEAYPEVFVYAQHPSVARAIINTELIEELLSRKPAEAENEADAADEPVEEMPAEAEKDEETFVDLPEEEVETAEPEPEKPKKQAKKKTGSAKKAKPAAKETAATARYDLLPLDVIEEFLDEYETDYEWSFFTAIEAYKKGRAKLVSAAVAVAHDAYADGPEAVMRLAEIAGQRAEESIGSDDVLVYVNDAVKEYLLYLREGDESTDHTENILWDLICGAASVI